MFKLTAHRINQYQPLQYLKYVFLIMVFVMASISIEIGLLDPIMTYRAVALLLHQSDMRRASVTSAAGLWIDQRFAPGAELSICVFWLATTFMFFVVMNPQKPRLPIRLPAGRLAGRVRIQACFASIESSAAANCNLCLMRCEGASDHNRKCARPSVSAA